MASNCISYQSCYNVGRFKIRCRNAFFAWTRNVFQLKSQSGFFVGISQVLYLDSKPSWARLKTGFRTSIERVLYENEQSQNDKNIRSGLNWGTLKKNGIPHLVTTLPDYFDYFFPLLWLTKLFNTKLLIARAWLKFPRDRTVPYGL